MWPDISMIASFPGPTEGKREAGRGPGNEANLSMIGRFMLAINTLKCNWMCTFVANKMA